MSKRFFLFLFVMMLTTLFTRFVNLTWGAPFYFHPDERNIASSISQLRFPTQLNPHFFAYGSLPIYSIYASGMVTNMFSTCHFSINTCQVGFEQALMISRIFSATFSTAIVFLLVMLSRKLYSEKVSYLVGFLAVFSTGFIQFSHFGTFEMWTTFFSLLLCSMFLFPQKNYWAQVLLTGSLTGILISIKVSNLVFLPLTILLLNFPILKAVTKDTLSLTIYRVLLGSLGTVTSCAFIFFLTNPFVLLDTISFRNSMQYESSVALGSLPVFYTQEFVHSIPLVYQYLKVFPFLLTPVVGFCFPLFLFCSGMLLIKKKSFPLFILLSFFTVLCLPQAFLFVKWIRYMLPTLPFLYLLIGATITYFLPKNKFIPILSLFLISTALIHSVSFVYITYLQPDTRTFAAKYLATILPGETPILSEVYDLGIVPFNANFPHITLFNFYDIDTQVTLSEQLTPLLTTSNVVILPSQRVLSTRRISPSQFPVSSPIYNSFFTQTQYKKLYETPCTLFCQIVYLGDPVTRFEQTASVFDRPTVYVFQKL